MSYEVVINENNKFNPQKFWIFQNSTTQLNFGKKSSIWQYQKKEEKVW